MKKLLFILILCVGCQKKIYVDNEYVLRGNDEGAKVSIDFIYVDSCGFIITDSTK